ncbi:MAG TPA: hypothetical protein VMD75_01605 [Candidatus Binataceae bacterium]|nr:hypothetical protein [Candidatus Binataceae bacterium]
MNGYEYLVARNRLIQRLEDDLKLLADLPRERREAEQKRLQAEFDIRLRELYAQVAEEYPGERRKKARPLNDPR